VAIGESAGDFDSFQQADWVDSEGNKYAVSSMQCTATLFQYAGGMLTKRDFAPDEWSFELASFAQSKIELWMGDGELPSSSPEYITGIVMDDPQQALDILGLARMENE